MIRKIQPVAKVSRFERFRWTLYGLPFVGLLLLQLLFPGMVFGTVIVVMLGVAAVWMGIKSLEVFRFAIAGLVVTMILTIIGSAVVEEFALYAFLLLAFGFLIVLKEQYFEVRQEKKQPIAAPPPRAPGGFVSRRERLRQ